MKRLRAWARRLAGLIPNERRERELDAEIESNLLLHIDDNLRAGMTLEEARRKALLTLGGVEPTKEAYRERSTVPFLDNLIQDARFAIRQLRKNPGFTATAILMLALGMCASVAIFAFVDAALIKPLPYPDPNRLTGVYEYTPACPLCNLSYPDYLDWKRLSHVFGSLAAYRPRPYMLSTPSGTEAARGAEVSDNFFPTLGVAPALGRGFYAGEELPAAPRAVVLSYKCWRNRYGARKEAPGEKVTLDGVSYTIVGVLPRSFQFAPVSPADYFTPIHVQGECEQRRSCHSLYGVGRLKDGISLETAQADTALIAKQLEKQYPGSNMGQGANVITLAEAITGNLRTLLLVLLSGAGLLLLIAFVNIASLLLVRSESRKRELAVRSALGASRGRLVSQFVTEALVLVMAGSVIGVVSGYWAMQLMSKLIPADMLAGMPYLEGLGLNARVLEFAAVVAGLAAVFFSIIPALRVSLPKVREGLAEGSRGSAGNTWRRLGSKLVVLELATAVVLLVGAGLLGKSFYLMLQVELGIQPDHLATLQVAAPVPRYEKDADATALARNVLDRVARLPGVRSAGACSQLPVSFNGNTDWIRFVGKPFHGEHNEVNQRDVSWEYFNTVKAKLVRGRYFRQDEDKSKPNVIIINQALAGLYFPGEDPIGKLVGDGSLTPKSIRQIVGVVANIREGPLDQAMLPTEYTPFDQDPGPYFALVVRTSQDEESVIPALTAVIRRIDPDIVTLQGISLTGAIHDAPSTYVRRSATWFIGAFAAAALLLGVIGLYGVIAYSVSQRTREIGVRMALGAQPLTVYKLILKEAGWLTAAGIALGLALSAAAGTLIRKMLFGTPPWDAATFTSVAAVLGIAALLASYLPARRAASVNPVDALRAE
jgi:macrolide transport system ATP-binding/permease protein